MKLRPIHKSGLKSKNIFWVLNIEPILESSLLSRAACSGTATVFILEISVEIFRQKNSQIFVICVLIC